MSAHFHSYLCGRKAAEWLISVKVSTGPAQRKKGAHANDLLCKVKVYSIRTKQQIVLAFQGSAYFHFYLCGREATEWLIGMGQEPKVYVEVVAKFDPEGHLQPQSIRWEDGTAYEIDKVLHVCRAASLKAGGAGIRYTVRICNKKTYLFLEKNRWFVERRSVRKTAVLAFQPGTAIALHFCDAA